MCIIYILLFTSGMLEKSPSGKLLIKEFEERPIPVLTASAIVIAGGALGFSYVIAKPVVDKDLPEDVVNQVKNIRKEIDDNIIKNLPKGIQENIKEGEFYKEWKKGGP